MKKCYLNPLLKNDLKKINPQIEYYIFPTLSEGLKYFSEKLTIESLPDNILLDKIKGREKELIEIYINQTGGPSGTSLYTLLNEGADLQYCPNCDDIFIMQGPYMSKKGKELYLCRNCMKFV